MCTETHDAASISCSIHSRCRGVYSGFGGKIQHSICGQTEKRQFVKPWRKGILILTGGPGTGKTTTLNAIIQILEFEGEKVLLGAPTGRAAKRMTELTGCEAKTIHRLLQVEWNEQERPTFSKNEQKFIGMRCLNLR